MQATINTIKMHTPDIYEAHLALEKPLNYVPGQYILLYDKNGTSHAFSIVESYQDNISQFVIVLFIKKHGGFTNALCAMPLGTTLKVSGPFGRFIMEPSTFPAVFIGAGIGITPLYSMIQGIRKSNNPQEAWLFYSAKKSQMILQETIEQLHDENTHIQLIDTTIQPRITPEQVLQTVHNIHDCTVYICGPNAMITSFRDAFEQYGLREDQIRSEEFQ